MNKKDIIISCPGGNTEENLKSFLNHQSTTFDNSSYCVPDFSTYTHEHNYTKPIKHDEYQDKLEKSIKVINNLLEYKFIKIKNPEDVINLINCIISVI